MKPSPELTLAALRHEFPRYRIWLDPIPGRHRFVARRQHPGPGPHTVITSDAAELRAALTAPSRPEPAPGLPRPGGLPDFPDTKTDTQAHDPAELNVNASGPA
jgi:hypothetical protein